MSSRVILVTPRILVRMLPLLALYAITASFRLKNSLGIADNPKQPSMAYEETYIEKLTRERHYVPPLPDEKLFYLRDHSHEIDLRKPELEVPSVDAAHQIILADADRRLAEALAFTQRMKMWPPPVECFARVLYGDEDPLSPGTFKQWLKRRVEQERLARKAAKEAIKRAEEEAKLAARQETVRQLKAEKEAEKYREQMRKQTDRHYRTIPAQYGGTLPTYFSKGSIGWKSSIYAAPYIQSVEEIRPKLGVGPLQYKLHIAVNDMETWVTISENVYFDRPTLELYLNQTVKGLLERGDLLKKQIQEQTIKSDYPKITALSEGDPFDSYEPEPLLIKPLRRHGKRY
jgi:hypothetical protein